MKLPPLPRIHDGIFDAYMRSLDDGLRGDLSPWNLHEKARRQQVVVPLRGVVGGESLRVLYALQPLDLSGIWVVSNTATAGSTSTKYWQFSASLARSGTALNTPGATTSKGEIQADIPWSLGTFGQHLVAGDIVVVDISKVGFPTNLSSAELTIFLSILLAE